MASPGTVLLLRPPPPHVLLSAHLPPRSSDSTSLTAVSSFIIRVYSSSSPSFRKFTLDVAKQLWGDPKRIGKVFKRWFARESRTNPSRIVIRLIPRQVGLRSLLSALLRKATVQAVVVATATLMAIHLLRASPPAEEDPEQALRQQRLPSFVREGVRRLNPPRGAVPSLRWPPRTWTTDAVEALRFDKRRRDMDDSDPDMRRQRSDDPVSMLLSHLRGTAGLKTEHTIYSVATETETKNRLEDTNELHGKKEKAALSELEREKIADAEVSLKKIKGDKSIDRSVATHVKLQLCLAALRSRETPDGEVSLKKMKQGDNSISNIRKYFAPVLGTN